MPTYRKRGSRQPRRKQYSRKRTYGKKRYSRMKPSLVKKVKKLSTQMRNVQRIAKADIGTLTYRNRESRDLQISQGFNNVTSLSLIPITIIQSAISSLPYFDPSSPGVNIFADGNTGTYQRNFRMKPSSRVTCRNNYRVPVNVRLYLCLPKENTSVNAATAYTIGITDIIQSPSININNLVYPTDSVTLGLLYRIIWSKQMVLQPGQQYTKSHGYPSFNYDPSFDDTEGSTFYPNYCGAQMLVRGEGVVGHDSVADEMGTMQCAIDMQFDRVLKVTYGAGVQVQSLVVDDGGDIFSNTGIISNKPAAINQAYQIGAGF